MKCHVPGPNVKVLGRTIHALARFGDELYLESLEDCILLRTLNASETAYAIIKLNKNFFSHFNYNYDCIDNDGLKWKISMKSALKTFKSPAHMDKNVENLEIKLDSHSSKLIFKFKCKHDIVKTHYVSILDCQVLNAIYIKDLVPNRITAPRRLLAEAIRNFHHSNDQVTLEVSSELFIIKNYVDFPTDNLRIIRSQVPIKPFEFSSYIIGTDTHITFTFKEFRALLYYAEALSLPVELYFEVASKPAQFVVQNGSTIEARFVLATSQAETETQCSPRQTSNSERKREEDSNDNNISAKKAHLHVDASNQFEPTNSFPSLSHDIPIDVEMNTNNENTEDFIEINLDGIPVLPAPRIEIKSVLRKEDSNDNNISAKKVHLDVDASNQFKPTNSFTFISDDILDEIPSSPTPNAVEMNTNNENTEDSIEINLDEIPSSPTPNDVEMNTNNENTEDSIEINLDEIPSSPTPNGVEMNTNNENTEDSIVINLDDFPDPPTPRTKIKSVFKRCFESTFDPRIIHSKVLADNSDSD